MHVSAYTCAVAPNRCSDQRRMDAATLMVATCFEHRKDQDEDATCL